ncbi:helix-turn-helix transcriptional regulator [Arthrobacter sp. N199823]|uniref:helix-turn-helix transcriptional regulator n=1 Tax=Arthrobacter sp. N199823 TaxID=2058895 RepID=UPI000CE503A3|nr:helix-turn-helix transcriptional regulator [Arthrobacter sp. N199823]
MRSRYHLSQDQLGRRVGVSRQTIASLESGQFRPGLPLAFRLAHLFKVKIEDLFTPDPEDLEAVQGLEQEGDPRV